MKNQKINYLECSKGGLHDGQSLNFVCLNPDCASNNLCCCTCIELEHKNHQTKPLKLTLKQAQQISNSGKGGFILNTDIFQSVFDQSQNKIMKQFQQFRKEIEQNLKQMETVLIDFYSSLYKNYMMQKNSPTSSIKQAIQSASNPSNYDSANSAISKIIQFINNDQSKETTELDPIQQIKEIEEQIKEQNLEILKQLNISLIKQVQCLKQMKNSDISEINSKSYKFTPVLKAQMIQIVGDYTVKSISADNYRFAMMQPCLEKGKKIKKYSFNIVKSTKNWIAVGMCHKKIVQKQNYTFPFGNLGHGAYMISSNSGSWSSINAHQNNKVMAYSFSAGDTVNITVDFTTKIIKFNTGDKQYKLEFKTIPGDQLYPCVLFYHQNDEVKFVNK